VRRGCIGFLLILCSLFRLKAETGRTLPKRYLAILTQAGLRRKPSSQRVVEAAEIAPLAAGGWRLVPSWQ